MNKKIKLSIILISAILLTLFFGFQNVNAGGILYVKPGGSGDCSAWGNACDLQYALGVASSVDEIWVAQGTYKPASDMDRNVSFHLKSGVAIYGGFAGTETSREQRDWSTNISILSGDIGISGDINDNSFHVVNGSGTDHTAILDGFSITEGNANGAYNIFNGGFATGGGMYNYQGSPTLVNLKFFGNYALKMGGVGQL